MMLFILIGLELNTFLKKSDILLERKACTETYLEYKQIIKKYVDIFALDLLTMCLQAKL